MEQDNTTRMVCDDCSMQFDTNNPENWGIKQDSRGKPSTGAECPNPGCHSIRVHKVG